MRRALSVFVAVCLVLSLCTGVFAPVPTARAKDYFEDPYYYILNGTTPETATLTGYTVLGGAVVIPDTLGGFPVTNIGDHAFFLCGTLTSVIIPDSVTSIGALAFCQCFALTSVTIGSGVISIGVGAFESTGLTSVIIPDSVTSIGERAFHGCSGLTSVAIGHSVTNIGVVAFAFCSGLTSVTIPDSVTYIDSNAFLGCASLTGAYFLGNAPTMGFQVFQDSPTGFTVYYVNGTTGWTDSPWIEYGYTTAPFASYITPSAGPGGSISPSSKVMVLLHGDEPFTITSNDYYHVADVLVDGSTVGAVTSYTFTNVIAAHTIAASFAINTYTVTYNANSATGGTVPTDSTSYYTGDTVTVLTNSGSLVRTHYTFNGWNKRSDGLGTHYIAGSDTFYMGLANVTLYAEWTANTYTVTFNKNGGDTDASPTTSTGILYNGTATLPTTTPTWVGHTFASWNTQSDGNGTTFTASTLVTASIMVYAKWTLTNYTAHFNAEGGSPTPGDQTVAFGTTVSTPATPTYTGHTLAGWYTEATYVTQWNFGTDTMPAHDITLYAKWTTNTFTITASAGVNGTITPSGPVSVTYGASQSFTITPNPGYMIDTLTVDGGVVSHATNLLTYFVSLTNVVAPHAISVTFRPVPDVLPPTITLPDFNGMAGVTHWSTGPVQTFTVSTSPFPLTFTLDDNSGSAKWTIRVNGVVIVDPVGTGLITYPVPLSEGRNEVMISAVDASGNSTSKELIIFLDSMNPVLTINPALPASVTNPELTITGSVVDTGSGLKHFTINGTEVIPFLDGSFSEKLLLTKGANSIVLEAEDRVGHQVTATYTVTYAVAVPTFLPAMTVTLTIGKAEMDVNGMPVTLDAAPVIQNNRTLLPIRALIETLGGTVIWDAMTRTATVTLGSRTVSVTIGNPIGMVNGKKVAIDTANAKVVPVIINSRTFLPLRFIGENLGLDLAWEPVSKTISFTYWP